MSPTEPAEEPLEDFEPTEFVDSPVHDDEVDDA
jgi:hypothetical protein